jgi:hypothetical protein
MDDHNQIESRLWEYIDGLSTGEERSAVEKLIAEHRVWRTTYAELLEVHQSIQLSELEQPSLRFTKNVMEEIARLHIAPAAKQYINNKIIWSIAAFFITVITSFVVYGFAQINWAANSNTNSDIIDKVAGADYTSMFNNNFVNAFMLFNVVLGLMLFDRYLNDRKKRYMGNA